MTLQNRVTPLGEIVALSVRGTMMGNRGGRIHDPQTRTLLKRRFASKQWICCVLDFKGRHRPVMQRGYTELFFLDEVTALAAGHRPCFECRRSDAIRFADAFARGNGYLERPSAPQMDAILHAERLDGGKKRLHEMPADLPDGAMVLDGETILARRDGIWLRWTPEGYLPASRAPANARLVTPPSIVAALAAGYQPRWQRNML